MANIFQMLAKVATACQKLAKGLKDWQKVPQSVKSCHMLLKLVKSWQKFPLLAKVGKIHLI